LKDVKEYYFKNDGEWRDWLHENHSQKEGIYLIFFAVSHEKESMRWEEAVKVALCYGWIDSTVKNIGPGKRRQYFCPRKPKSVWSKVNKDPALDDVEKGIIPKELQDAFDENKTAFDNFQNFTRGQRKSYLYYLNQAKRQQTREKRVAEIVSLSAKNIKARGGWGS